MDASMTLGEALRAWREALGLTQSAAAEEIGCGRRSWQQWETGKSPVPKYILLATMGVTLALASGRKKKGAVARPPQSD